MSVTPRTLAIVVAVLVILVELQFASQKSTSPEKAPEAPLVGGSNQASRDLRDRDRRETAAMIRALEDDLHLLRNKVKRNALKIKTMFEKLRWEKRKNKMKRKLRARLRHKKNKHTKN
jgi:hypothetical protein